MDEDNFEFTPSSPQAPSSPGFSDAAFDPSAQSPLASPRTERQEAAASPKQDKYDIGSTNSNSFISEDDNSPLRIYQRQHEEKLQQKTQKSEAKREQQITDARNAIEQFYQKRAEQRDAKTKENRISEKKFVEERDIAISGTGKNQWENVSKLIDFKAAPSGKDNTRMRKILIELKSTA